MSGLAPIPPHVPPHLVRDIDIYDVPGGTKDPFAAWSGIQQDAPDIFFTPHYGGYWVLNRAEHFHRVLHDPETFSNSRGTTIPELPEGTPPFPPLQIDPPLHRYYRQPFNLALSPKNIIALSARAREVVIERLDTFRANGRCEFMHDMALHVPITIVMQVFDLPFADREFLIPMVDTISHSSDHAARGVAIQGIAEYAARYVDLREKTPGDDLISKLLQVQVDDRPITKLEVSSTVTLLLLGGLDTVSHSMGQIMRHLAQNPDTRRELAANPALIPGAIDELLRRVSIVSASRSLKQDAEIGDVTMKKGDRVLLIFALQGLDEREFDNPMETDFARPRKDGGTFGGGIHRCVGAGLARAEFRALLEEWFKRIPEFSLDPDDDVVMLNGQTQAVCRLPLVWPA